MFFVQFYWSGSFCGILFVSVKSCSFQFALCSPKLGHLGMHIWTWASLKATAYFCISPVLYVHIRHTERPLWKKEKNSYFSSHKEKLKKSPVKACRLCIMNEAITTVNKTYHGKCEIALPLSPPLSDTHAHTHTNPAAKDKKGGIAHWEEPGPACISFLPLLVLFYFEGLPPVSSIRNERKSFTSTGEDK